MGEGVMLKDKLILVLGCYGDFAREIVLRLHREGAGLILVGRSRDKFLEKFQSSGVPGLESHFYTCDLSDESDVVDLRKQLGDKVRNLYGIVNCVAFPAYTKTIFETDLTEWQRGFEVDVNSVFLVIKHFGPYLRDNGKGSIVNFTSFHLKATYPNRVLYNACKSAVEGITRSTAVELGPMGIRVNGIAPGPVYSSRTSFFLVQNPSVKTKMLGRTPLNKLGQLSDVADTVVYLLSDLSGHMSGQQLIIDGGWTSNAWFDTFDA
jgi:NAD(P)-dependent dehydrogenase (short-subunit alcohol dehydrogenase family)